MGKSNTVIAPSGYARSSDLRISNIIKGLIGRSLDVFLRNRGMTFDTVILGQQRVTRVSRSVKWTLGSSPSMTATAKAECVPTPDCASIGYTATSCTGDSLKCPFDTSKLFCIPCDTKYKYTGAQTGQKGKGTSCDGKYIECECNTGYDLVDGNCVISCAYTLTKLPTGCSAVSDTCTKNGKTYYSSTCISCQYGYTLSYGSCYANACSGYSSGLDSHCASYTTCTLGTTTLYNCTACESGYTLNITVNQCIDDYCYNLYSNNSSMVGTIQSMNGASSCSGTICIGNDELNYCMGYIEPEF